MASSGEEQVSCLGQRTQRDMIELVSKVAYGAIFTYLRPYSLYPKLILRRRSLFHVQENQPQSRTKYVNTPHQLRDPLCGDFYTHV